MSDKRVLAAWLSLVGAVVALSLLPGRALPAARAASPWIASAGTVMLVPLGLLLEFVQRLIPGRAFEWKDVAADGAAVLVGLILGWVVRLVWRPEADLRISR